jgi:FkbM family methyltransferase
MKQLATKIVHFSDILVHNPVAAIHHVLFRLTRTPDKPIIGKVNGKVNFEFDFTHRVTYTMYLGKYERHTQRILRRLLHPGGIFVDVGANIGYISAYAASQIGSTGAVHAFEPVPIYYSLLERLTRLNPNYHICANKYALGDMNGTASIDLPADGNIGWNTMVPGLMSQSTMRERLSIPVCRLDNYLLEHNLHHCNGLFIKIDTEGFELPVLLGTTGFFERTSHLPILLIEVAPSAYAKLNRKLEDLEYLLKTWRYSTYQTDNLCTPVNICDLQKTTDILCMPPEKH